MRADSIVVGEAVNAFAASVGSSDLVGSAGFSGDTFSINFGESSLADADSKSIIMSKLSADNGADVSASSIVSSVVVGVVNGSDGGILDDIIDVLVVSSVVIVVLIVVIVVIVVIVIVGLVSTSSLVHVVLASSLGSWVGHDDWN